MVDVTKVRKDNDLMGMLGGWKLRREAGTNGGEWSGPCPFCGGHDRFRVQPNAPGGAIWMCHHCTDSVWKDVIEFVIRRDHKTFQEACDYLGAEDVDRKALAPFKPPAAVVHPPPGVWQAKALKETMVYEHELWAPGGQKALGWLHKRGLHDQTIKQARLGFNPAPHAESLNQWGLPDELDSEGKPSNVFVPRGVVIPGLFLRLPWFMKVRRPEGDPKYIHIKGSKPALYLAESVKQHSVVILVEGEFDALLLDQEAGSQIAVCTLGSAYNGLTLWRQHLMRAHLLLVAYHHDEAGQLHANKILHAFPDARPIDIPKLKPEHKDLTDFYCSGGNLQAWISELIGAKR